MIRYCWAWNRVYVKSNGRIPCWCDTGEKYTIIQKDPTQNDFIRDVVNSPEMREMRLSVIEDQKDFIQECEKCCCMIRSDRNMHFKHVTTEPDDLNPTIANVKKYLKHVQEKRGWEYGSIDKISEIQLEPTFPCNLRCPGCLHGKFKKPLEREDPPYVLPLEYCKRIMDSILYNNVNVERISFVGRGEPTLNKEFPEIIDYCRSSLPKATFFVDTNANQPYHLAYDKIDWIHCSIDGPTEEAYKTYRRGGNFDKAMAFMREAVKNRRFSKVCWKYILFDTTDGDAQLLQSLRIAKEYDIDCLRFIITSIGAHDKTVMPSKKSKREVELFLQSQTIFDRAEVVYAT